MVHGYTFPRHTVETYNESLDFGMQKLQAEAEPILKQYAGCLHRHKSHQT